MTDQVSLINVFKNLYDKSPKFKDLADRVSDKLRDSGGKLDFKLRDDIPGGTGARTTKFEDLPSVLIEVEKDAFNGDYYIDENGDEQLMTLDRYLAEELKHAEQLIDGTTEEREASDEVEAQNLANDIMQEAYGEPRAKVPHINDIVDFPNTYPGTEIGPQVRGRFPPGYSPISFSPDNRDTPQSVNDALDDWGDGEGAVSPLVFDLDGDGIELASSYGSGSVYWDIDLDNMAEQSGWITGGDGLLAIDLNDDGIINDHSELFGTEAVDGFTVLSAYDSNSDNVIDVNDTEFNDLLIWVDANADGYSDIGELSSLNDFNITSINLNPNLVDYDIAGNQVTHESTFTMNGQTQTVVDAWFNYNNTNSLFSGEYTLDLRTIFLPTLRGYGDVPSLDISMNLDENLLLLVQDIADADTTTLFDPTFDLTGKMTDIFFKWTDVENVDPTSRGTHFDGQKLAALEAYLGQDFVMTDGRTDPAVGSVPHLTKLFDELINTLTNHILVQTAASVMYEDGAYYDPVSGVLENSTVDLVDLIPVSATSSQAVTDADEAYVFHASNDSFTFNEVGGEDAIWLTGISQDDVRLEKHGYDLRIHYNGEHIEINNQYLSDHNQDNSNDHRQIETLVFEDGTVIDLLDNVVFKGTEIGETVKGLNVDDTLIGLGGNDYLEGNNGDDILIGGLGEDNLKGGMGNDIYEWSVGDGDDTITENGGVDQLHLKGITQDDVRLETAGYDLEVHIGSEYITLDDFLKSDVNQSSAYDYEMVDEIIFDDGSSINLMGDLTFNGTDLQDTVKGTNGADTLEGKLGNDNVYGGHGDDTYIWHLGDGEDTFSDSSGIDTLRIHDVHHTGLRLEKSNNKLYIDIANGETLTVSNHFASGGNQKIETIELDNGYLIDLLLNLTFTAKPSGGTMRGTDDAETFLGLGGQDTFYAYGGDDTLEGGTNDDNLYGGTGNDTYIWSAGDGDDTISDTSGQDVLELHNVISGDIRMEAVNSNLEIYIGSENITVNNHFNINSTGQVEFIQLDDSTQIDLVNNVLLDGTSNNETLRGSGFSETLNGLAGNDSIYGYDNNDVLNGGEGSDYLYGGYGDDVINGGDGIDMLYGQNGADTFLFEALTAFNFSDNIQDFDLAQNDKFDVSDLLQGYDAVTDAITDFVQITESGSNSYLSVDADGGADNFVQIAYIYNETGLLDEAALEASGNLITV